MNGIMPFRPGREHLHHRLLNMGIKPKKILIIFVLLSIFLSLIGFSIEFFYPNKEYISFYTFCALAFLYFLISNNNIKENV
jgi:UDP-GlcNAc:undecaprenyl-phosphate GlcNAc-1-phosphate transferase